MRQLITVIGIIFIILLAGCSSAPEPSPVNITNGEDEFIYLDGEGTIPSELCSKRGLDDKIIIMESKYCSACKIAVPILKELEQELETDILFLDLSKNDDREKTKEFGIIPKYTPTILIGCNVIIGVREKQDYKQQIENFLSR